MLAVSSAVHNAIRHPAWREIQATLMDHMHAFVIPYKDNPSALQILLQLCGDAFAKQYFPTEHGRGYLLVEPHMTADTRRELEQQLLAQLLASLAPHMTKTLESSAMDRLKQSMAESYHAAATSNLELSKIDQAAEFAILHVHGHLFPPSLSTRPSTPPPSVSFLSVVAKKGPGLVVEADPALSQLASADEARLFQLCHGRSLPVQLRQLLWFRRLYVADTCTDVRWRIQANQTLMSLSQPWTSPIASLLFRHVRDSLVDMPTAAVYADDQPRLCDTLNLWYVLTKQQSNHFLHLAMPLVHLFPTLDSKDVELVSCLHVFVNTYHRCAISRGELNAAAQRVWRALGAYNSKLFQHIDAIYANAKLDLADKPSQLFTSWIQSAFVGYLSHHAVNYVWDQCMLSREGWRSSLELFCVDVCGLLAPQLLGATCVAGLEAIVEIGPRSILTQELRQAHRHRSPSLI